MRLSWGTLVLESQLRNNSPKPDHFVDGNVIVRTGVSVDLIVGGSEIAWVPASANRNLSPASMNVLGKLFPMIYIILVYIFDIVIQDKSLRKRGLRIINSSLHGRYCFVTQRFS
jgi:hypothetical protein